MTHDDFDPDRILDMLEAAAPDGAASGGLPPDPSLTGRQAAFADAYADLGNAAAAARQAGYAAGSAKVTGSRLLTNANVLARIEALRKVRDRARALDRQVLLGRLEETWQAAMDAGRFHAAMQALRMMAELAGLAGQKARQIQESADLDGGSPVGPLFTAMADAAHTRRKRAALRPRRNQHQPDRGANGEDPGCPDRPLPSGGSLRARAVMGTPGFRESLKNSVSPRP